MDYYNNKNYYDILGVEKTASFSSIEKAKDRLKFGSPDDRVPFSMWGKIDEAYSVLSNPDKRKEYDKKLEEESLNNEEISIDEDINIYSNSDHSSSSLIKNPINETYIDESQNNIPQEPATLVQPEEESIVEAETTVSEEQPAGSTLETREEIEYTSPFAEVTSKSQERLKTIGKYVGGVLVGFSIAGPIGAVVVTVWLKKHKTKLVKSKKVKKITKIATEEMSIIEEARRKLDNEINKLLSEPHNNYKLKISELKYQNQIDLLNKLLEIRINKKVKKTGVLKNKLEIFATKMQIETATKNLEEVRTKIVGYENNQKLTQINNELIQANRELSKFENQQKNNSELVESKKYQQKVNLQKLKIYQSKLLNKRNLKATKIKAKVTRSGKMYDNIARVGIKNWAKSLRYITATPEEIDEFLINENQNNIRR